jgi:integrase
MNKTLQPILPPIFCPTELIKNSMQPDKTVGVTITNSIYSETKKYTLPPRSCILGEHINKLLIIKKKKKSSQFCLDRFVLTAVILFFTGMRISEASSLTQDNLKTLIETKKVVVWRSKTKDYHSYAMGKKGVEIFQTSRIQSCISSVFKKNKCIKGNISIHAFTKIFNKYLEMYLYSKNHVIELTNNNSFKSTKKTYFTLKSHSFRINYITTLINKSDLNLTQIARIVGHKKTETTDKYYRYRTSDEVLKALDKASFSCFEE